MSRIVVDAEKKGFGINVKELIIAICLIYNPNPMTGIISGFRWCLFGGEFPVPDIYLAAAIIVILFISSLYYFKSVENVKADIV